MPVIKPTVTDMSRDGSIQKAVWAGLVNGDTGAPVSSDEFHVASAQVTGTFGVGGSVTIEGSNDEVNYVARVDKQGVAATKTAAGMSQLDGITAKTQPHVTAGDGTTSITVTMILMRPTPMRT